MGDFLDKAGLGKVKAKIDAALATKLNASLKGVANGVAELDANGYVPSSQLPSYVDDVVEYLGMENFPTPGEIDKIYVDTTTNKTYRWSGSRYVQVSESLALGETSGTAYRGDRGKTAYDHAMASGAEYSTGLYKIRTNAEGHVVYASPVIKSDITDLGIPGSDTNTTYAFSNSNSTLAWDTTSTIGTVGGVDLTVTMPANPDTNTTYSFSNNNPTLAWGTTSTVGTVGGVPLTVTMPGNPNTNTTYSFSNKAVTLAWNTTHTIATVGGVNITLKMPANPNTNTTYSFRNGNPTLAWGATSTVGTAGGVAFTVKMPANPNTNTWRGIQNNLTSTSTTDSLSAAQGKALNDKFTDLFKVVQYSYTCPAVAANTTKVLTGSNFGYNGPPSGYVAYALHSFSNGNGHISVATVNINATGSGGLVAIKNTHQSAPTGSFAMTVRIAFIKTGFGVS